MVDARIQPNLVEHNDPRIFGSLIKLPHRRAHIAGSDNMRLALDSGLDHLRVVGVRNQGDNEIVFGDGLVKSLFVVDVERDGGSVGEVGTEGLGTSQSTAGYVYRD
jgi:hypothetical protein